MSTEENNLGPQPVDDLMTRLGIANADLVKASTEQLTFKMVQKARKGRRLTTNAKNKILDAIQTLNPDQKFKFTDLFNY